MDYEKIDNILSWLPENAEGIASIRHNIWLLEQALVEIENDSSFLISVGGRRDIWSTDNVNNHGINQVMRSHIKGYFRNAIKWNKRRLVEEYNTLMDLLKGKDYEE